MTKFFRCAILGAPASGKGTLSERIIRKFDIFHVSTGDILRQYVERKTELGETVNKYISAGKLVPDSLMTKIALDQLKKLSDRNWLLDGFPRTLAQAKELCENYPLDLAINLDVPFEVILNRVKGRWVHPASGRVYNEEYKPPKVPGVDDVTGEPLVQRPDDREEAVLKRLEVYRDSTMPLIEFYRGRGILKEFSGKTSDEIWPKIEGELVKHVNVQS